MDSPRRLHPVAVITLLVKNVYVLIQALLPIGIVLLARGDLSSWLLMLIPVAVLAFCAYTILAWWRLVYYVRGNELYLESGVFTTKKRSIPFERIQGVQINAGIIQRLFGLVSLEVQTAGNEKKAEFSLQALTRRDAEELKALISSGNIGETAETKESRIEETLSLKALLQAASTSNGIGVIFLAIVALLSQVDQFVPGLNVYMLIGELIFGWAQSSPSSIALLLVTLLVLSWFFSVIGSMITLGGFKLTRLGDRVVIDRGILSRRQVTLPINKLQAIVITESLLRQPFGLASVEVISAGYGNKGNEAKIVFPILPKSQVQQFLARTIPEFSVDIQVNRLPVRALQGYLYPAIAMVIIAAIVSFFVPWGYLLLLPAFLLVLLSGMQYLDAGYAICDNMLIVRSRFLGRKTHIIPLNKIQWLDISSNPLQERARLANVRIALMSQISGTIIKLHGADAKSAVDIQRRFRGKAELPD